MFALKLPGLRATEEETFSEPLPTVGREPASHVIDLILLKNDAVLGMRTSPDSSRHPVQGQRRQLSPASSRPKRNTYRLYSTEHHRPLSGVYIKNETFNAPSVVALGVTSAAHGEAPLREARAGDGTYAVPLAGTCPQTPSLKVSYPQPPSFTRLLGSSRALTSAPTTSRRGTDTQHPFCWFFPNNP